MMRKRGISDLAVHLVEPSALAGANLEGSIAAALDIARRNGMRHVLLVTSDGKVVVAGSPSVRGDGALAQRGVRGAGRVHGT